MNPRTPTSQGSEKVSADRGSGIPRRAQGNWRSAAKLLRPERHAPGGALPEFVEQMVYPLRLALNLLEHVVGLGWERLTDLSDQRE
jgi:hypothetical protein